MYIRIPLYIYHYMAIFCYITTNNCNKVIIIRVKYLCSNNDWLLIKYPLTLYEIFICTFHYLFPIHFIAIVTPLFYAINILWSPSTNQIMFPLYLPHNIESRNENFQDKNHCWINDGKAPYHFLNKLSLINKTLDIYTYFHLSQCKNSLSRDITKSLPHEIFEYPIFRGLDKIYNRIFEDISEITISALFAINSSLFYRLDKLHKITVPIFMALRHISVYPRRTTDSYIGNNLLRS